MPESDAECVRLDRSKSRLNFVILKINFITKLDTSNYLPVKS